MSRCSEVNSDSKHDPLLLGNKVKVKSASGSRGRLLPAAALKVAAPLTYSHLTFYLPSIYPQTPLV